MLTETKTRDLALEDVLKLRRQIVLNSLFYSDYQNNMGVDEHEACDFFDGFMSFIEEMAEEDGFVLDGTNYNEFFRKYDTAENLEEWFGCFEECPLHEILDEDDFEDVA